MIIQEAKARDEIQQTGRFIHKVITERSHRETRQEAQKENILAINEGFSVLLKPKDDYEIYFRCALVLNS